MSARPPKKFVVVDDEAAMLKIITALLEAEGHDVITESDSLAAAKLISREKPDCLITDLVMPGMDGLQLIGELKGGAQLQNMKVVMVTTRTDDLWRKMAQEKGVDGFINKPLDPQTFATQVARIIDGDA